MSTTTPKGLNFMDQVCFLKVLSSHTNSVTAQPPVMDPSSSRVNSWGAQIFDRSYDTVSCSRDAGGFPIWFLWPRASREQLKVSFDAMDLPAVVRERPVAFPYDFYGRGLLEHNLRWIHRSVEVRKKRSIDRMILWFAREMPVAFP